MIEQPHLPSLFSEQLPNSNKHSTEICKLSWTFLKTKLLRVRKFNPKFKFEGALLSFTIISGYLYFDGSVSESLCNLWSSIKSWLMLIFCVYLLQILYRINEKWSISRNIYYWRICGAVKFGLRKILVLKKEELLTWFVGL